MSNLNLTTSFYCLPFKLAFLEKRWSAFWDVLYYCAAAAPRLELAEDYSGPLQAGPVIDLRLDSRRFCRLLWGLPEGVALPLESWETGRKLYRELSYLAHQSGLLHKVSEDEDDDLPSYGSKATHRLWLLPPAPGDIPKPVALIENGWLARCGNRYERHLLNLFCHNPALTGATPLPVLVQSLQECYDRAFAPLPASLRPSPVSPIALQRALGQALTSLQVKGLHHPLENVPPALTTADRTPGNPRLANYFRKDAARAGQLQALLASGYLHSYELKAAWATLARFPLPADFNLLLGVLQRRSTLPDLSWRQVEASALARRSKRGTRNDLPPGQPAPLRRYLSNRQEKLQFGSHRTLRLPLRPALDLHRQRPARTRLEVRAKVARWQFQTSTGQASCQPTPSAEIGLRLTDSAGELLYQSSPLCISAENATAQWVLALDTVFSQPHPDHDLSLLYLELNQLSGGPTDWLTLATRLTWYT